VLRFVFPAQQLALVPEVLALIVFLAHTRICREEHAAAFVERIVITILVEPLKKITWRGHLMKQLLQWLGDEGTSLWMWPQGSVKLDMETVLQKVLVCVHLAQ
jgi:hypothetical protein